MKLSKRVFTLPPLLFSLALGFSSLAAVAQEAPVVKSFKILEALTSKDIVVDRSDSPGSANNPARSNRSMAIDLQVQFAFNSADLQPQGRQQLDELAMALSDQTVLADGFEVIGHTDRVGSADYNVQLSMERAVAVKNYLVTMHGLSPVRLKTAGMGYTQLADPSNPSGAINRRVEIRRLTLPVSSGSVAAPTGGVWYRLLERHFVL